LKVASRGLQDIARRRAELLVRSEALRTQFAASARAVRHPFSIADRARDAVHWARGHPQVLLAAGAAFALARPRRVVGWSLKLWGAWRVWRQVMAAVRG
jgi:hypothetical protein